MDGERYGLVIVGSGAAGLAAATTYVEEIKARGLTPRVAVIESSSREQRGGSTRWTTARFRVGADDKLDPFVIGKVEEESRGLADLDYMRELQKEAQSTIRFLEDHGVELMRYGPIVAQEIQHETRPNGGGHAIVETLATRLEAIDGVDLLYELEAVRLTMTGEGRVDGVVVRDRDGLLRTIQGDAVLLACGGFEGNAEMLSRYIGNSACDLQLLAPGVGQNQGAGIRMAMEVGAATSGQFDMIHSELVDRRTDRADAVIYGHAFGIVVNGDGERFYDEGQGPFDSTFELIAFEVWKNQKQNAFFIGDQTVAKNAKIMLLYDTDLPPVEADTIAELADQLGLDPDRLTATVEAYNAAVSADPFNPDEYDGKHTTGLNPDKSNWAYPLNRPPFFAYPMKSAICFTYGGLKADVRARVVTGSGVPIPGLYAAGEIVGVFYHQYPAGTSVLRSLTFGRIAGREAAALPLRNA
ncbi:MAG TPA: FAD-binding protein [Sphingomonadaceae bacterium]|nr:FAD-binding protein [Sphingomonadaceae bacterium]